MGRRTPSSEVFREWDAIAFPDGRYLADPALDEWKLERWKSLYERCFEGGEWRVPVDDALLVATMGMSLGLGRYEEAVEAGDRLFAHPDVKSLSPHDLQEALCWHGGAQLSVGRIEAGCRSLRRVLDAQGHGRSSRARRVLGAVAACAETMEPTTALREPVRDLAMDALADLSGTASLRKALAGVGTMGELCILLDV